jgi:hypothetical protein
MQYKKSFARAALGTLLALSVSGAMATTINGNYLNALTADGDDANSPAFNIYDFAVGATLIHGAPTNLGTILAPQVGDMFTTFYQSYVVSHQLDGVVQSSPWLNTSGAGGGYELTLVASFTEVVTSVSTGGFMSAATGGTAAIYFDTTPDYNLITDSGFINGEQILSGTVVSGGSVTVPSLQAGFAQLDIKFDTTNNNIFSPAIGSAHGTFTLDLRSNAVNGVTTVLGQDVAAGDRLLGADANFQLEPVTPVPVPAAVWLLGSAVTAVTTIRRRAKS